ncbi:S24 family peptidase [Saccharicrinis fermentans]|nr:S24 family peptidase [Saccharicrinis fermentans]
MSIISRILLIAENEGVRITSFEKIIGASKGVLSRAAKNNTDIQSKWITSIVEKYPKYNAHWLLTGNGEMLHKEKPYKEPTNNFSLATDSKVEYQTVPLYDIEAYAGLVPLFKNGVEKPLEHISIPGIPKCDGAVHVTGDSMYPLLKSGDIVLYKKINNIKDNIFFGEMYLISVDMDGEEYVAVKYINKSELKDHIKLVSYNQYHAERDIPLSKVRALAFVKASIRINSMN